MNEKQDQSTIKTAKKKNVSWNDGQIEGKIDEHFLEINTSASPTKQVLEKEISELMQSGYSEIEASSMVGKAQTPSGKVIITDPIFYDSKDKIAERKFSAAQTKSVSAKTSDIPQENARKTESIESEAANRYSFFTQTVIGVGVALAFAATIGITNK
ncbi:hypothetical protein DGG96_00510 [Legionella qingyii]|uniref:Uncharacterized protein n=1 Tax=Legionella qingyii TaxID=2184757 RepID=A0A317U6J1_9GAMM|nr:hypothetical protein [Legionella qingyii]PWY57614.1 hypothetical protein DGG96_00510 [Legionella qingyii]RUR25920.1 hypothetical protein ELY20_01880 [Legionella qingyii]RUR29309.1 hypothetical protein ELY16_00505 [Legionella qingyii]